MPLLHSREQAIIDEAVRGVEALFAPTIGAMCKLAHDGVLLEGSTDADAKAASEKIRQTLRTLIEASVMNGMTARQELENQRRRDRG